MRWSAGHRLKQPNNLIPALEVESASAVVAYQLYEQIAECQRVCVQVRRLIFSGTPVMDRFTKTQALSFKQLQVS